MLAFSSGVSTGRNCTPFLTFCEEITLTNTYKQIGPLCQIVKIHNRASKVTRKFMD